MCLPRACSRVQTDVLCLSRVAEVSPLHLPLVSSSLLSPFHEHLFSRAGWVTPASQWRRAGMRSPYKPVAITAGVATELGGAPYRLEKTPVRGRSGTYNAGRHSAINTLRKMLLGKFLDWQISKQRGGQESVTRRLVSPPHARRFLSYLIQEEATNAGGQVWSRSLTKQSPLLCSPHTYVCICVLTPSFDQYEEGNVQTNTITIMYSPPGCVE